MTLVHRFTSPDWFNTTKGHLAGASGLATNTNAHEAKDRDGDADGDGEGSSNKKSRDKERDLFAEIVELDAGESLLFAPTAVLEVKHGEARKLGSGYVRFRTRRRLGEDGGKSVLAVR